MVSSSVRKRKNQNITHASPLPVGYNKAREVFDYTCVPCRDLSSLSNFVNRKDIKFDRYCLKLN